MAFSQVSASQLTVLSSVLGKGFMACSLTDWSTSALTTIASGSAIEIGGSFFLADSAITPTASSWTSITTATTAYLALTASGTAGSMILSAAWTSTAPTWREDMQAWYATAASVVRVIGSAYKVGATQQETKTLYTKGRDKIFTKIVNIGDWNMDADITSNIIVHGLDLSKIRSSSAVIINDTSSFLYNLDIAIESTGDIIMQGWIDWIDTTSILLERVDGGFFDSSIFNSTSFNRGFITITYEA
jgi:hypothetical protein